MVERHHDPNNACFFMAALALKFLGVAVDESRAICSNSG